MIIIWQKTESFEKKMTDKIKIYKKNILAKFWIAIRIMAKFFIFKISDRQKYHFIKKIKNFFSIFDFFFLKIFLEDN